MSTTKPGERTPGHKTVGPEAGRIGGIASGRARAAAALAGKKKWTKEETLEHLEFAQSAVGQALADHEIVRAMMKTFNQIRLGPPDKKTGRAVARNPITKLRAKRIIARVYQDWHEVYSKEMDHIRIRSLKFAMDAYHMARNGQVITNGGHTFITKPTVHGTVQALVHLARIQGVYAPEKIHMSSDLEGGGLKAIVADMSESEIKRSIAASRARFPHLFPDQVGIEKKK